MPAAGSKITALLHLILLTAGLVLSVISELKICSDMCSETGKYSIFGLNFGWFGIVFFSLTLFLLAFRRRSLWCGKILQFGVLAATGAEVYLVWIQKYKIGAWCPVCLCIAVTIAGTLLVLFYERSKVKSVSGGENMMTKILNTAVLILVLLIGFGGALVGVQRDAGAAELDIYFGKRKSDTTVYFISDWFCPVCRKIEPDVEKLASELKPMVRLAFVDMPIHPESANFTPYHLQCILYEKEKYLSLRHALDELSRTTKTPTPEQVQATFTPLGVTLRPQNFMEILNGIRQFETIYKGFKVTGTPSVIVDNTRTKKRKLLVGSNEINRNVIKAAIAEVEK
jgi:uncharacterized membrane protein